MMRQSGLCKNEIENFIFEIAQKNNTDDPNVIADAFVLLLCKSVHVAANAAKEDPSRYDIEGFRVEIKNFLHGCTDLEAQRVVRSRKSESARSAVSGAGGVRNDLGGRSATKKASNKKKKKGCANASEGESADDSSKDCHSPKDISGDKSVQNNDTV